MIDIINQYQTYRKESLSEKVGKCMTCSRRKTMSTANCIMPKDLSGRNDKEISWLMYRVVKIFLEHSDYPIERLEKAANEVPMSLINGLPDATRYGDTFLFDTTKNDKGDCPFYIIRGQYEDENLVLPFIKEKIKKINITWK